MISIVAADDHALFRVGLRALLEMQPNFLLCDVAIDGSALLKLAEQHAPHIVITDHEMPGISGLDLVSQLRQRVVCKVIVMTGIADANLLYDYDAAGVDAILLKQEDPDLLIQAINQVSVGRRYISTTAMRLINSVENIHRLTNRERQVIRHIAKGLSTKEISQAMGVSPKTIDSHRTNLMQKLDLHSAAEVAVFASSSGLT